MDAQNELDQPVTKREFSQFLKDDFGVVKTDVGTLKTDVGAVKESIDFIIENAATKEEMRQRFDRLSEENKENTDKILISNDKLAKKLDTFLTEKTVLGGRMDDQDAKIEKVEHRVARVETHVGLPVTN